MIVSDYYTIIIQVHRVVTFVALYYRGVFIPIYVIGFSYGQVNLVCIVHYSLPNSVCTVDTIRLFNSRKNILVVEHDRRITFYIGI